MFMSGVGLLWRRKKTLVIETGVRANTCVCYKFALIKSFSPLLLCMALREHFFNARPNIQRSNNLNETNRI